MTLTKEQLKAILDTVFTVVEGVVKGRFVLQFAVQAIHAIATSDAVLDAILALLAKRAEEGSV